MLLNYPVITSGEYAHRGSFKQLLGGNETEELLELLTLEKQVTEHTPPAFIWHTYTDQSVPVQNSLLLIGAMKKYEIPVEFHMYPVGKHGLSTCSRLTAMRDGTGIQKSSFLNPFITSVLFSFINFSICLIGIAFPLIFPIRNLHP